MGPMASRDEHGSCNSTVWPLRKFAPKPGGLPGAWAQPFPWAGLPTDKVANPNPWSLIGFPDVQLPGKSL